MQKEKATQALSHELDMWSFYEAGDWPVARTGTDFIRFLLSPGTQSIEIVGFDNEHMTFALYGPFGEDGVPGVVLKTSRSVRISAAPSSAEITFTCGSPPR